MWCCGGASSAHASAGRYMYLSFLASQRARMRPGRVTFHHSSAARHHDARGKGQPDAGHVAVRDACVMRAPLACVMRA